MEGIYEYHGPLTGTVTSLVDATAMTLFLRKGNPSFSVKPDQICTLKMSRLESSIQEVYGHELRFLWGRELYVFLFIHKLLQN